MNIIKKFFKQKTSSRSKNLKIKLVRIVSPNTFYLFPNIVFVKQVRTFVICFTFLFWSFEIYIINSLD